MTAIPIQLTDAAYGVWEILPTGRHLRLFADEDLAMQFAVANSSQVVRLNDQVTGVAQQV